MKPLSLAMLAVATLIAAPAAFASPLLPQVIYNEEAPPADEEMGTDEYLTEEELDDDGPGFQCGDGFRRENRLCVPE